jgi:ribose transport system substrate-binding protein
MKKIISVVLVLCLVLFAAACGAKTDDATTGDAASGDAASGDTQYEFGLSVPSLEFTFFAAMKTAVESEFPRDGISVTVYNGENNQEKQNKDVEDMISKGVDGIVLIPITVEGAIPAIKYANEQALTLSALWDLITIRWAFRLLNC